MQYVHLNILFSNFITFLHNEWQFYDFLIIYRVSFKLYIGIISGGDKMTIYATLVKFSAQEVTAMTNTREALEEGVKMAVKMGIKLIGTYATISPHGVMLIYEAPNEEVAEGMVTGFSSKWGGQSETLTLIPVDELPKLAGRRRGQT
jgi:uncharacterized protein with GYD domain